MLLQQPQPAGRQIFFSHISAEDVDGLSPRNEEEAKLVCAFAHFQITHVGVDPAKITILTPFKGQLHILRNMIRSMNLRNAEDRLLDCQTVDMFQGKQSAPPCCALLRCLLQAKRTI